MALSPDIRRTPRFVERTPSGEITAEILNTLTERMPPRPGGQLPRHMRAYERAQLENDYRIAHEQLEGVEEMAGVLRKSEKGPPPFSAADIVNELVVHFLSREVRQGNVNPDRSQIICEARALLPQGKAEGRRFAETMIAFRRALQDGTYDLLNDIYDDPEQYCGREGRYRVEHINRERRYGTHHLSDGTILMDMNTRLKGLMKLALSRQAADLIDSTDPDDHDRFAKIFGNVDFIDELEPCDIPLNPARITGNPSLQTAILTELQREENEGLRPKCTEARQLLLVPDAAIPVHLAESETRYAARRGSAPIEGRGRTFEQTATDLSQPGGPLYDYQSATLDPDVLREMGDRLAETFRGQDEFEELHWGRLGPDIRRHGDKSVDVMVVDASRFDEQVLTEVFEPMAALPAPVRTDLIERKNLMRTAIQERNYTGPDPARVARRASRPAEIARLRGEMNTLCQPYQRMDAAEFRTFMHDRIRPHAMQNLADILARYPGIAEYTRLRDEYERVREATYVPYTILERADRGDTLYVNSLRRTVHGRLTRARAVADGGVSYAMARDQLTRNEIVEDAILTRWGFAP